MVGVKRFGKPFWKTNLGKNLSKKEGFQEKVFDFIKKEDFEKICERFKVHFCTLSIESNFPILESAYRKPLDKVDMLKIPVTTISYGDAKQLLK